MTRNPEHTDSDPEGGDLYAVYDRLLAAYGPQGWWPGDGPWEVLVGAVLTQHTAWTNVERALVRLKADGPLTPAGLRRLAPDDFAEHLRPTGTFRVKAARLQALLAWCEGWGDDLDRMARADPAELRRALLAVHGIGPETADAILLYALDLPTFVVDASARRVFGRLGHGRAKLPYGAFQAWLHQQLAPNPPLYGEYHALLVRHGKVQCRPAPRCEGCCLQAICQTGKQMLSGEPRRSFDNIPAIFGTKVRGIPSQDAVSRDRMSSK